ncbi:MAG: hypothetical protein JRJ45_12995 [Deltaproteobacteria bacterium]|nr:hypothetical protein [Deltaproteobacteria bacterium]
MPCVVKVSNVVDGEITPGKGMGRRISRRIEFQDLPYHDRFADKYWNERTYDAESQGTYFGKLLVRNNYKFEGSVIRVKAGYLTQPFDSAIFETRTYVVDKVEFTNNKVVLTVTDFLRLADNTKVKVPALSTGSLSADITSGATSLTLIPAGIGNSEYAASGTFRINDELMAFTRSADVCTLTRAQGGTTADAHSQDDTVQECYVKTLANVVDVIYELLNTYVGINASYLPLATSWEDEKALWLVSADASGTVSEPTGVLELLTELCLEFNLNIWWDDRSQEITLKANMPLSPGQTAATLTEAYELIDGSVKTKDIVKDRITRVWVLWNPRNLVELEENKDYANWYVNPLTENLYNTDNIRIIRSRWITSEGQAAGLAGRQLSRFKQTTKRITFQLDAKDAALMVGDTKILDTKEIQNAEGGNAAHRVQIVAMTETKDGDTFSVTAVSSYFSSRYAFITQSGASDYSSATDNEKALGGYISETAGANFSDGTEPYRIP